jgi:Rad3-related DNA helicase
MKQVYEILLIMEPGIELILQTSRMSEYERDRYINRFQNTDGNSIVGLAVLGGAFAESIDLLGERLTGAVIVGVGLPKISLERELIKDYFNQVNGSGFAYSYQIPGMIKVLQAAGRVIRSENDRGSVLFIGKRFTSASYRHLLPEEWDLRSIDDADGLEEILSPFWNKLIHI